MMEKQTTIAAFKGFDKGMACRGYKYEIGKTYTHDGKVEACKSGFHACENPFDVWSYYGPHESRFAAVTMSGEIERDAGGDSKIAAAKITIDAEIPAGAFVRRCVDWVIEKTKKKTESGDYAHIGASGNHSVIASAGRNTNAKGAAGTWISLAEYDADGRCIGFAVGRIGDDGLKADTYYRAENGKLVEAI